MPITRQTRAATQAPVVSKVPYPQDVLNGFFQDYFTRYQQTKHNLDREVTRRQAISEALEVYLRALNFRCEDLVIAVGKTIGPESAWYASVQPLVETRLAEGEAEEYDVGRLSNFEIFYALNRIYLYQLEELHFAFRGQLTQERGTQDLEGYLQLYKETVDPCQKQVRLFQDRPSQVLDEIRSLEKQMFSMVNDDSYNWADDASRRRMAVWFNSKENSNDFMLKLSNIDEIWPKRPSKDECVFDRVLYQILKRSGIIEQEPLMPFDSSSKREVRPIRVGTPIEEDTYPDEEYDTDDEPSSASEGSSYKGSNNDGDNDDDDEMDDVPQDDDEYQD